MDRRDCWRIATLNIWNRQGPWAQRLPLLRAQLQALDADAIALQEVLGFAGMPSQAHEIAEGTGWNVHYAPAWEIGGGLSLGNAILSPHALSDQAVFPLPSPPELDARTVCFARVDAPHGPIPMFVVYFHHQGYLGRVRRRHVRALCDLVEKLAPLDGPPPVLAGDFNADPDSDEMRFLRGLATIDDTSVHFADAWLVNPEPGFTYDRRNDYALRSREPSRRIDYIYVRGPGRHLCGEPLAARLVCDEPTDGVWPSDHFGVVAEIAAAKRHHDPF